jgi:hypothetical protein
MSVTLCEQQCFARNFAYAGVRNTNQCICGNTSPSQITSATSCTSSACPGNSSQNCGSNTGIAVYNVKKAGIASDDFTLNVTSAGYVGCFHEGSTRVLANYFVSSNVMTNDLCLSNCKALGYAYAGTENGTQCFCGNKPDPLSGGYPVQDADCSMSCPGGSGKCGAASIISIWSTVQASSTAFPKVEGLKGCFGPGTFVSSPGFRYSGGYMTTGLCRRTCRTLGFSIAGVTNGNTCACGNTPTYGAVQANATCNLNCQSDPLQPCGSSSNVDIYDTSGAGSQPPSGYPVSYVGCWIDSTTTRVLGSYSYTNTTMTSAMCRTICQSQGLAWYGTEYSTQCFCGGGVTAGGALPDSQCSSVCGGGSESAERVLFISGAEFCGGSYKMSLYHS